MVKRNIPKIEVVGFTGDEDGMNGRQHRRLDQILGILKSKKFVHGSCVGADTQAHHLAVRHGMVIEIFPCDLAHMQVKLPAKIIHPIKRPLDRNRDIVAVSNILLATPKELTEIRRSGPWATIRYARLAGIPRVIILPDGKVQIEGDVPQLERRL
jgi:hypothetical protein